MKDLSVGNPMKVLLNLSLPLFLSVIFQQIYSLADSVIAGQYAGESALAAIGASSPITMIFLAIAFGCNIGCAIVISRFFGQKNYSEMKSCISTTIISSFVLSVALAIFGLLLSTQIMEMINTPANIFANGRLYLNIYFYGLPFIFLYNVTTGVFTSLGDSKTPLYFLIASSLINIFLDYLFVAVWDFGIAGVAWATFIAQGIACILALIKLYNDIKKIKTDTYIKFSFDMLSRLAKMAVPSILQQSFVSVGNIFIQIIINGFGSAVIAGFSASMKLNMFALSAISTLGNGLSAYTSQNLGAGETKRISKGVNYAVILSLVITLPFATFNYFNRDALVHMFLKTPTAEALKTSTDMMKIVVPFYFVIAIKITVDGALRGIGNMSAFMASTFSDLLIRVGLSFALCGFLKEKGVFFAWPIGWTIGTVMAVYLWIRSYRKLTKDGVRGYSC